jgi:hypothetical protein
VDGRQVSRVPAANDYQDLVVTIPPAPDAGAVLVMNVAPTFVPGGRDPRVLGVQLDRFLCRPGSALVRPPSNTLSLAALAAAIFAFGLALVGLSLSSAMFAAAAVGLGQTVMMAVGSCMYGAYPGRLPWLALCVILPAFVLARAIELARRQPLTSSARFVVAAAASVMFLKLAGLLHPAKPVWTRCFTRTGSTVGRRFLESRCRRRTSHAIVTPCGWRAHRRPRRARPVAVWRDVIAVRCCIQC